MFVQDLTFFVATAAFFLLISSVILAVIRIIAFLALIIMSIFGIALMALFATSTTYPATLLLVGALIAGASGLCVCLSGKPLRNFRPVSLSCRRASISEPARLDAGFAEEYEQLASFDQPAPWYQRWPRNAGTRQDAKLLCAWRIWESRSQEVRLMLVHRSCDHFLGAYQAAPLSVEGASIANRIRQGIPELIMHYLRAAPFVDGYEQGALLENILRSAEALTAQAERLLADWAEERRRTFAAAVRPSYSEPTDIDPFAPV